MRLRSLTPWDRLPTSIAAADLNGDGHADLVIGISALKSSDLDYVNVLLNDGSGTFAPAIAYPTGVSPVDIVALDLNEDGKPDLVVADRGSDEVRLFMNHGDGTFPPGVAYALGRSPRSMIAADLNGNGRPDLAIACGTDEGFGSNVTLLLSLGAGTFAPASTYAAGKAPTSIAAGDFNADGKPDLAVANPIDNDNNVRVLSKSTDDSQRSEVMTLVVEPKPSFSTRSRPSAYRRRTRGGSRA